MHRSVMSLMAHAKAAAVRTWVDFAEDVRLEMRQLTVALGEWRGGSFRRAWLTWLEHFSQCKLLRAAVHSMSHRSVRRAFNQLSHVSNGLQALRAAAMNLRNAHVRRAINEWKSSAALLAERRTQIRRALGAMLPELRDMRRAYLTFCDFWVQQRLRLRAIAGFRDASRMRMFNTWSRGARAYARQQMLLRRCGAALSSSGARRACNTWVLYVRDCRWRKERLRRGVMAMLHSQYFRACSSWRAYVRGRARSVKLLRRGAVALRRIGVLKSFNSWHAFTIELAPKLCILRRAAAAVLHGGERFAFNKWASRSLSQVSNRAIRGFGAFGIDAGQVCRAILKMRDAAQERRRWVRAAAGFVRTAEVRALRTWQDAARTRREQMGQLRQGLTALVRRAERLACTSWQLFAAERAEQLRLLNRAAVAISQRGVMMAFNSLCAAADARQRLVRAAAGFVDGTRLRAFSAWQSACARRSQQLGLMHRGLMSLVAQGKAVALRTWADQFD